jgi:hypothetical protein
LFSDAPLYPDLEQAVLADLLARLCETRGGDDPLCQQVLAGLSPIERARVVIIGTQMFDPAARRQLAAGGADAAAESSDPLVQLAWQLDPELRLQNETTEAWAEQERQAYALIADALFATQGDSTYPDATFTLRLAFGTVKGYEEDGQWVPPMTTMADTFAHQEKHAGEEAFQLPQSWVDNRDKIDPATPFNFVATPDIIGGNSGSPVVNKDLELVGLIFDGNIQSLVADRRPLRAFTAPASPTAPAYSKNFSVKVVLPASGWLIIANVRLRLASSWADRSAAELIVMT